MLFSFFILFLLIIIYYIYTNKIKVIWKTLFKKGFPKTDSFFGLYCYTGKQGTGKTYSCIRSIIDLKLKEGYRIITNVESFDVFPDTIFLTDINKIIDYVVANEYKEKYLIFFDEIFTILEKKTAINKKILSFISQLRKRKILFYTTAQEWSEINITFRRYVRFQVSCNMFPFPITKTAFLVNKINDGYLIKWDNDSQDWIAPTVSTNFMKGNLSIIESYDTFETIKTQ